MPLPLLRLQTLLSLVVVFLSTPSLTRGEKLTITSDPPGATVEINGIREGTTPFEKDYPGGYFRRTKTVLGSRLEHTLVARISLAGYATREIQLTDGPMEWISTIKHASHGQYWLIKSTHFEVALESIPETFTGHVATPVAADASETLPELSLAALTEAAKPAVVQLKSSQKMGSGFFVTDTGVIATNAHLGREEGVLLVTLSNGLQLEGTVVYVDADLDIALVKISGRGFKTLPLAAADTVKQGEAVFAIGNPASGLPFSVTQGIVSGVGKFPNAGPGTWVQTDTPINPGNSGGPLLNTRGQVVGMNTLKVIKKNVTGIAFALSGSDLLRVLARFYEVRASTAPLKSERMSAPTQETGQPKREISRENPSTGIVTITGPAGATILIDDKIVGQVPSTLTLSVGPHRVRVSRAWYKDWMKPIYVTADSRLTLVVEFEDLPTSPH